MVYELSNDVDIFGHCSSLEDCILYLITVFTNEWGYWDTEQEKQDFITYLSREDITIKEKEKWLLDTQEIYINEIKIWQPEK